jgi:hypothetical protein
MVSKEEERVAHLSLRAHKGKRKSEGGDSSTEVFVLSEYAAM